MKVRELRSKIVRMDGELEVVVITPFGDFELADSVEKGDNGTELWISTGEQK
jgi:hypothetical protein